MYSRIIPNGFNLFRSGSITKISKNHIPLPFQRSVEGFCRKHVHGVDPLFSSSIPLGVQDLILLMFAKPMNMNIECKGTKKQFLVCPVMDHFLEDLNSKIAFSLGFADSVGTLVQRVALKKGTKMDEKKWRFLEWNEHDVFDWTPSYSLKAMEDKIFVDAAKLFRTLPASSKPLIWNHSVKIRRNNKKQVANKTTNTDHIRNLLCDSIIVYIKVCEWVTVCRHVTCFCVVECWVE